MTVAGIEATALELERVIVVGAEAAALAVLAQSRKPTEPELSACRVQLEKYSASDRARGYSDILWALLNSAEFALNH